MRRIVLFSLTVAITVLCCGLGVWQLRRLAARRAANREISAARALRPLAAGQAGRPHLLPNRRAVLTGELDEGGEFVLRDRVIRGVPAVIIVTPLRLPGADTAVLVNRGYVPALDAVDPGAATWSERGERTFHGMLLPVPDRGDGAPLLHKGRETWRGLDLTAMRGRLPYPVAPLYLVAEADSSEGVAHTIRGTVYPFRAEPTPLDDGPHLMYAVQWFGIAAAVLAFGVIFVLGGGTRRRVLLALMLSLGATGTAPAQDAFEIQVYEYATVPRARWDLETHVNFTSRGTSGFDGPVAPSQGQAHLAFELTRGITDHFEMAGYLVLARRPGHSPDFVAWRLRPRVRLPETWLPIRVSLSAEVAFPRREYENENATLELRPILERQFGRVALDVNPVLGRSVSGPGSSDGWEFEPGGRLGVTVSPKLDLSVEYYGAFGPVHEFLPAAEQVHQVFGGGDINFSESVVLNLGLGFGLTPAGNRTVFKARLGWIF